MSVKKILILGGYGITGALTANLLLQYTGADLILSGRNILKAEAAAARLNKQHNCGRVTALKTDASNYRELTEAFGKCDFVLAASSTAKYTGLIVKAALAGNIDYMDINYSSAKLNTLRTYETEIKNSGRCFITDGGFHPGLPALLIRHAAEYFDNIETAAVASIIKVDWNKHKPGRETVNEFIDEAVNYDTRFFLNGEWYKPGFFEANIMRKTDFGSPFGVQKTYPMFLGEMESIPVMFQSLKEAGFFISGFNPFVDYAILPGAALFTKAFPSSKEGWSNLLEWGLTRFAKPPYGTVLKIEASGTKDNEYKKVNIALSHEDGYFFTAAPVASCISQYLEGTIVKPGLHFMAHIAEPGRTIEDLKQTGIKITNDNRED